MSILIVEDDESIARFLKQTMEEAGYNVVAVGDGEHAREMLHEKDYDLILLDVMLPKMDGLEICRRLRAAQITTPVLMLTAKDTLEDKIAGLDSGADDYLVKPFQVEELLARSRALLRRRERTANILQVGDLILDTSSRRASRSGKVIPLSLTEFTLLEYLMRHGGKVVQRSLIMEHVWQYDFEANNNNVLDVYISYLRSKVDKGFPTSLIQTVRGVGYKISADESA